MNAEVMTIEHFRGLERYLKELEERDPSTDVYVILWIGREYHSNIDRSLLNKSDISQIRRVPLKFAKSLGYEKHC